MNVFKKKTTWLVIGFLILFLWFIEAEAETILEVAPVVAYGGDVEKGHYSLIAHERFDKYDVGVILLLDFEGENGNRAIEALRVAKYNNWEAGLGWTVWSNIQRQAWNTDNTFSLMLGYQGGRWSVRLRHWSTGGTSSENSGLDMLTIGYSFGDRKVDN